MSNYREFGDGVTIPNRRVSDRRKADEPAPVTTIHSELITPQPEMAVAAESDDYTVPKPLPWWFDLAAVGTLIILAGLIFTAIIWGLTWH